jgi:hypothetical protein
MSASWKQAEIDIVQWSVLMNGFKRGYHVGGGLVSDVTGRPSQLFTCAPNKSISSDRDKLNRKID